MSSSVESDEDAETRAGLLRAVLAARFVLPPVLLAVALVALHRVLLDYRYEDIVAALRGIERTKIVAAAVCCVVNFAIIGLYDVLALRALGRKLPMSHVFLAALTSYSVGQTVGLPALSSAAVRYRFYRTWGLSGGDVARVVVFVSASFWFGLLANLAGAMVVEPGVFSALPVLNGIPMRIAGALIAMSLLCVVVLPRRLLQPIAGERLMEAVPNRRLTLLAALVGIADWFVAALVVYFLLPGLHEVTIPHAVGAYMIAQAAGLVSHVPGGLGVFESSFTFLLLPRHAPASVFAALVVYRCMYYLVPFGIGVLSLAVFELRRLSGYSLRISQHSLRLLRTAGEATPVLLAGAVFVSGGVMLVSGALPPAGGRWWWLTDFMPLSVIEGSHFLNSIVGSLLIVLAISIRKRSRSAWRITLILLIVGAVLTVTKGLEVEEAIFTLLVSGALYSARGFFSKGEAWPGRVSREQLIALIGMIAASTWIGFVAHRDVAYSSEIWWKFGADSDAPRFLRASVGAAVVVLTLAWRGLLRPTLARREFPDESELDELVPLVRASSSPEAHLALLGDKFILMSDDRRSFLMYRIEGRSWISMGDPVAESVEDREALIRAFREMVSMNDGLCVFYEVSARSLPLYLDEGLSLFKLGEEAVVPLDGGFPDGAEWKSLRRSLRKLEKEGCTFEIVPRDRVSSILPRLREISEAWLGGKSTSEKGFSLGFFDEWYLARCSIATVSRGGTVIAFANLWETDHKQELSVDLIRFIPDGPNGLMDYLFLSLMMWGKAQGYSTFNLGMAPFSGFSGHRAAPLWNRVGSYLFRHGEHFYNFQGLRTYKEKFNPRWEPKYLASPGGLALPAVLTNVATLISGGVRRLIGKSAPARG